MIAGAIGNYLEDDMIKQREAAGVPSSTCPCPRSPTSSFAPSGEIGVSPGRAVHWPRGRRVSRSWWNRMRRTGLHSRPRHKRPRIPASDPITPATVRPTLTVAGGTMDAVFRSPSTPGIVGRAAELGQLRSALGHRRVRGLLC